MAEIRMEKKSGGMGWLWILLAILAIALLAWLFWPDRDEASTAVVTATETGRTATSFEDETPGLAAILENPGQWTGREYSGTVTVPEVPTDRGFWIEENGARMFAILVDEPREVPKDINPGQQIRLRGTVRDASYLSDLPGEPLTAGTENIARNQQAYLVVDEDAIEILERPE
jgi:hypothetical protein